MSYRISIEAFKYRLGLNTHRSVTDLGVSRLKVSRQISPFAGYTASRNTGEEFKLPSELPCTPLLGGYT
ncbi:hypothetical protein Moror_3154 [Moniliophthora roreri MCA 2997]|uniref:Uncharacterized protein n=1 Tax=Moniliophthora roreri (strain MCA 2997) TaxID=1381753 RepID=V2X7V2_MONRO|nr:hypothetical protein Moror_3154 [Moniliophthora roreri MCA 2997]